MLTDVDKLLIVLLAGALCACGGGGSSSRSSTADPSTPTANAVTVSGTITFDRVPPLLFGSGLDYNNISVDPARGVTVELVGSAGTVHSTTTTGPTGQYQLQAPSNTSVRIQVKAEMISDANATWNVRVTDNTLGNALYTVRGSLVDSGAVDSVRDLHAASGWNNAIGRYSEVRSAAPLAILDVIYDAVTVVSEIDPSVIFPPLEVRWSTANTTASGSLTDGDIGTSFYTRADSAIYLVGSADNDTDEYDRHVIAHEWGHYVEDKLSRSDSIGGSHGTGDRLDMRVAFSEGFGYALAALVLEDSIVRDSFGLAQGQGFAFDVESNQTVNPGWYSEASVQSILYDIADNAPDGADQIAMGFEAIYNVMTSAAYRNSSALSTLFLFAAELKRQNPGLEDNIDGLVASQAIFGNDEWGTGESNDAGQETVLPVYTLANLATRRTLCTTSEFNSVLQSSVNKLGNAVFVRYPTVTAGSYAINTEKISGAAITSPVLSLYRNGRYLFDIVSNISGNIAWSGNLSAGEYVVILSEADAIPGCYSLAFSNN